MMKKLMITIPLIVVAVMMSATQYFAHTVRMTANSQHIDAPKVAARTGIVVATGLDGRVTAGLTQLVHGKAERLLISGVGKGVRKADIRQIAVASGTIQMDALDAVMTCCVELGFDAADTIGNALEASIWAKTHQLDHVIVVTSDFHMPRTMMAFRAYFKDTALTAYPVKTPWLHVNENGFSPWWHTPERIRLISMEMVKYLARSVMPKNQSS